MNLTHYQPGYRDLKTDPDEWSVDKVVKHRKKNGRWEFLTKWEGFDESDATWEPVDNFINKYCYEFVAYLRKHRISLDMGECLSDKPTM